MSLSSFEKQWQEEFSKTAKIEFEDYQILHTVREGLESYIKYFFKYFDFHIKQDNSHTLLLDLGCGIGTFSELLIKKGFGVLGVDYSESMIGIAKKVLGNKKINFQIADIYNLPLENNHFDIVLCLNVFQYLESYQRALKEIKRVLKDDGLLIIVTLNCFSFGRLLRKKGPIYIKRYNPYEFKNFLKKENFDRLNLYGIYFTNFAFLNNLIFKFKIYKLFNLFFPLFLFFAHSFYLEGKKME